MALFNGKTTSDPDFDYEILRARMAQDFGHRILEDGWGRYRVSDAASQRYGFEVSTKQARRTINRVRDKADGETNIAAVDVDFDEEEQVARAVFEEVPSPDELLAALGINESEWEVEKCIIKPYQGQQKNRIRTGTDEGGEPIYEDRPVVEQMYSAEVRLQPKSPWEQAEFVDALMEQVRNAAPAYHSGHTDPQSGNLARILIPDIHLGKDGFQSDWGLEAATERVLTIVDEFATHVASHNVERISLPLGHDLLHIDKEHISRSGTLHTTSSGTPVERSLPWIDLFLGGAKLGSRIVRRLLEVAPVDVSIIPGNHSEQSEIAIGAILDMEFRDSPDVDVDLTSDRERYYEWGVNGFMDTHGDTCPFNDLPINFANLNPQLWGRTVWHEVNTGHKHISKNKPVGMSDNGSGGTMVRISPSLSPQDAWHKKYHYHGMPGAECFVYNRERPGPFASYQRFLSKG